MVPPVSWNEVRRIRNTDIWADDFEPLVTKNGKLTSTILNAAAAIIADSINGENSCVFSSWLGPLVLNAVSERCVGSLAKNVLAASISGSVNEIVSFTRWAVPLCSDTLEKDIPAHWVLGWVDWRTFEIGIFDSMPELNSSYWAQPLLQKVVTAICNCIGKAIPIWENTWIEVLSFPNELERQLDTWSCGLFVLMALETFITGKSFDCVANSLKESFRANLLAKLIQLPISRTLKPKDKLESDPRILASDNEIMIVDDDHLVRGFTIEPEPVEIRKQLSAQSSSIVLGKRKEHPQISDIETNDTDPRDKEFETGLQMEIAGPSEKAICLHKTQKRPTERKSLLEKDRWVGEVEPHRIKCFGCHIWIKLDKKREYDLKHWISHKRFCKQITGLETKRVVSKTNNSKPRPLGVPPIATFFRKDHKRLTDSNGISSADTNNDRYIEKLPEKTVIITTKLVPTTPSIATIFHKINTITGRPIIRQRVQPDLKLQPCKHVHSDYYLEYILRTQTRSLGGVSFSLKARIIRQLFPYKNLPMLTKNAILDDTEIAETGKSDKGNVTKKEANFTEYEQKLLDTHLQAWARWEVNFNERYIKSTICERMTRNTGGTCDKCIAVGCDRSFQRSVCRKNDEAALSTEEQQRIYNARTKFTPRTTRNTEARLLHAKIDDPLVFDTYLKMQRSDPQSCFLHLNQLARDGKLKDFEIFKQICVVLADTIERKHSDNKNAKFGIRYPTDFLNFMVLLRSYGGQSAQQYSLLAQQIAAPTIRRLRAFVSNSDDALQNPDLIFENVARVKRFMDAAGVKCPVAVAGDCTKVRARLVYSATFGGHILGSTLPLKQCQVNEADDIDRVCKDIRGKKALATQVRAILIKIPLPQYPPQVIALIPTDGSDKAESIHKLFVDLLDMAAQLNIQIITAAADGASSELKAQRLMDEEKSEELPLTYEYPLYGIKLKVPVFAVTGPLISISDPPHGRKTCRNQPQHGTHTASLGRGYLVNHSLVAAYELGNSGLVQKDVRDVDKQDDGAARRIFHVQVLKVITETNNTGSVEKMCVKQNFLGLFVYLFVFGSLFDAWMSRNMTAKERAVAAVRARIFLHIWREHIVLMSEKFPDLYSTRRSFISPESFNIFNRICDTLLLLILAYSRIYPDEAFCPWLMGTEFVEHFFGLTRMFLPDYNYGELLAMAKHVMLRQKILLSGNFKDMKEKDSGAGYSFDFDSRPLTAEDLIKTQVCLTTADMNTCVEQGFKEAKEICRQLLRLPIPQMPITLTPLTSMQKQKKTSKKEKVNQQKKSKVDQKKDNPAINTVAELEISDASPDADVDEYESQPELESKAGTHESGDANMDVAEAAHDAARLSALSSDYEMRLKEMEDDLKSLSLSDKSLPAKECEDEHNNTLSISHVPKKSGISTECFLNEKGHVSIALMLEIRERQQSMATRHSERIMKLDPKYELSKIMRNDEIQQDKSISSQEASQRLRVVQNTTATDILPTLKKEREKRWKAAADKIAKHTLNKEIQEKVHCKNISRLKPLRRQDYIIIYINNLLYIGEVLDIYKKGSNSRYGSIDEAYAFAELSYISLRVFLPLVLNNTQGNSAVESDDFDMEDEDSDIFFTCRPAGMQADMHTHAEAKNIVWNMGHTALTGKNNSKKLNGAGKLFWKDFGKTVVKEILKELPKIKISGGTKSENN